jgi:transketolase
MIGICAGMAMRGCRPFAYTIATFSLYRPFEQIRDDLCYQHVPVTVVGIGAGVAYSTLGGTHHAQEDVAVMSALPNMSVLAPCDPQETAAAVRACVGQRGPVYLRLGKAGEPDLTSRAPEPFAFGRPRLLKDGSELCLLSYGPIMKLAFEVAEQLESRGRSVAVVNVHTLKPLDTERLARILARYPRVAVIEEHSERGGLAAQVKQLAAERRATCELHTFSLKDEFIHLFGSQRDMWQAHGLSCEAICERLRDA